MQNSGQAQRSFEMEESEKTIEFLRARLLSERSVSSTARKRADELAERVYELEEQLRIVSLQRKKAEKATTDVLAILETQGISNAYEPFYSSSEEDGPTKGGSSTKGGGRSQELSELDCLVLSRSLSWNGRKETPRLPEKYKDSSARRQSFASFSSSGKHRQVKSCRQIKHREHRSETSDFVIDSAEIDSQKNEVTTSSEGHHHHLCEPSASISNGETKSLVEKTLVGVDEANAVNELLELDGYGVERDMETALEHQTQGIDQYEAMEKSQREWEEKYRENISSTMDSYDPGNHSDITEEREEMKPHTTYAQQRTPFPMPEAKSEHTSNGFNQASLAHKKGSLQVVGKKTPFPTQNGSKAGSFAIVPHQTSDMVLGGVLNNLKRAKLLLHKHMAGKPSQPLPGFTVPGGCCGLFSLPTDFQPDPSKGNNLLPSSSGRSLSSRFVESSNRSLSMASSTPYCKFSSNVGSREELGSLSLDLSSSSQVGFLFQTDRDMNMMFR